MSTDVIIAIILNAVLTVFVIAGIIVVAYSKGYGNGYQIGRGVQKDVDDIHNSMTQYELEDAHREIEELQIRLDELRGKDE